LRKHFGNRIPETIIEPGRGLVGNAGVIEAEVVLISKKNESDPVRWVYLDIGKFGGLAETMDESIRYPIRTPRDGDPVAPCVPSLSPAQAEGVAAAGSFAQTPISIFRPAKMKRDLPTGWAGCPVAGNNGNLRNRRDWPSMPSSMPS
jgi:ornithine decarboxylase